MKSVKYKIFFLQYGRLRGTTLFTRIVFSAGFYFQDSHRCLVDVALNTKE